MYFRRLVCTVLLCMSVSVSVSVSLPVSSAHAGDEYQFSIPSVDGPEGGIAAVPHWIDATSDFDAFSLAVCYDEGALGLADAYLGAGLDDPDFEAFQDLAGGFTLAMISSLLSTSTFPAGEQIEAYVVEFELIGDPESTVALEFCELGDPVVLNEVLADSTSFTPVLVNGSVEIENAPPPGNHVFWIEDFAGPVDSTQIGYVMIDSDSDLESFSMAICHEGSALDVGAGALGAGTASADFESYSIVSGGVTIAVIYEVGGVLAAADGIEAYQVEYTLIGESGTLTPLEFCELGDPLVESEMVVDGVNFTPELEVGIAGIDVATATYDLDNGEATTLLLGSQGSNRFECAWLVVTNISAGDNQWLRVTLLPPELGILGPASSGACSDCRVFGSRLLVETSMDDGAYQVYISAPFNAGDVGKDDPLYIELRCRVIGLLDSYPLAVSLNTADSPGHDGPVGDRIAESGSTPTSVSDELGDYGVFWDPELEAGFSWAVVDYQSEFVLSVRDEGASGPLFLRGDTNGDGAFAGITDGLYLLRWAFSGGAALPCEDAGDVNDSGEIQGVTDSLYLLAYAFIGGAAIPAPGIEACGVDETDDDLECAASPSSCD